MTYKELSRLVWKEVHQNQKWEQPSGQRTELHIVSVTEDHSWYKEPALLWNNGDHVGMDVKVELLDVVGQAPDGSFFVLMDEEDTDQFLQKYLDETPDETCQFNPDA